MSTRLFDLHDRVITDTGSMVAKHNLLVKMLLNGEDISGIPYVKNNDVAKYHQHKNTSKNARLSWADDGNVVGVSLSAYEWNTPEPYRSMDVEEYCFERLQELDLYNVDYLNRLTDELTTVDLKDMTDFIRALIWITDIMRENNVVFGLGRGSSCASLILYVLDVNKVDPVKYDIPMEEFYK